MLGWLMNLGFAGGTATVVILNPVYFDLEINPVAYFDLEIETERLLTLLINRTGNFRLEL